MKEKLTSRDIQARETREKLLRTSMELIAREGYRGVTVSRICKECGVSVGTFYQYFSAKRELVALLSRRRNESIYQAAQSLDYTKPAGELYADYVRVTMEQIRVQGFLQARAILTGMMEAPDVGDLNHGIQLRKEMVFRILRQGRLSGEFTSAMDEEEFFWLYSATFHGILVLWCYRDGDMDIVDEGCRKLGALLSLLTLPA